MSTDRRGQFDGGSRAVAPVIGVILVVAITVILAAVIGTFALDFGQEAGDPGPIATVSMEDAGEEINTARSQFVVIEHDGGDSIPAESLRITVRYEV